MAEDNSEGRLRPIRVLVHEYATGGGLPKAENQTELPESWIAEGAAMRRAIIDDFAAVPGISVVSTIDRRLPEELTSAVRIMRIWPGRESEMVQALACHCDYTLVIAPETGATLLLHAWGLAGTSTRSLGSDMNAIMMAGDKAKLGNHLSTLGVPTPPGLVMGFDPNWVSPWEGPIVVKPVDGAGAIDTFVIDDPHRWPIAAMAMEQALVQPFLPGEAMSASFLVDSADEATLLAVGRQRIAIEDGQIRYDGGCLPVALDEAGLRVLHAALGAVPGLRGFVGVDFLRDGNRVTVLEINPRPTTSYVGLVRLYPPGTIAGAWLAACQGPLAGTPWPDRLRRLVPGHRVFFAPDGTIESEESSP